MSVDTSAAARKRVRTGRDFEAELNMQHRAYELRHCAKIWEHSPPFIRTKEKWIPKAGGGPIDRTGHVSVVRVPSFSGDSERWMGCGINDEAYPTRRVIPIAFDAKVLPVDRSTYQHSKEQQHQLHQLRDAHNAGVFAFLLVFAPQHDRIFMLPIDYFFTKLVGGLGVTLWEMQKVPNGPAEPFWLVPSVGRTQAVGGWDWIPLLQWYE